MSEFLKPVLFVFLAVVNVPVGACLAIMFDYHINMRTLNNAAKGNQSLTYNHFFQAQGKALRKDNPEMFVLSIFAGLCISMLLFLSVSQKPFIPIFIGNTIACLIVRKHELFLSIIIFLLFSFLNHFAQGNVMTLFHTVIWNLAGAIASWFAVLIYSKQVARIGK